MKDLTRNQQAELRTLKQDLQRHQQLFRTLVEEYSSAAGSVRSIESSRAQLSASRPSRVVSVQAAVLKSVTPTPLENRQTPVKNDTHWIQLLRNKGRHALPRFTKHSSGSLSMDLAK